MRKAVAQVRALHAIGCLALLAGCAVGPNYRAPQPEVPAHFVAAEAPQPAGNMAFVDWWRGLGDAQLDDLVDRAIRSNPDIEIALTRLEGAREYEAVVLGHALPVVEAGAAAARGTGTDLTRGRAPQTLVSADNTSGLKHINEIGGFDATWELDLFGR
jgi:outer membrane protein TolC